MPSKGQQELDEYIFTRKEMAKLLGITPNALRHRMRRGGEGLDYRFDGTKFLFKRARDIKVHKSPLDTPKNSHEKALREYDRKVQKRYNRGSTHREHGGEPPYKGKYDQQSFKHHNELKLLNSLQGKYKNDGQRREFENMNEEALKEADKRAKTKANIEPVPPNYRRGDRLRLRGEIPHYGSMLYKDGMNEVERKEEERSLKDWHDTTAYNQRLMGHDYYRPFANDTGSFFLSPEYDPANINNRETVAEVDLDRVEVKSIINDRPDFSEYREPKLAEALWCARRGKKGLEDPE
jgi:hypothetical protein